MHRVRAANIREVCLTYACQSVQLLRCCQHSTGQRTLLCLAMCDAVTLAHVVHLFACFRGPSLSQRMLGLTVDMGRPVLQVQNTANARGARAMPTARPIPHPQSLVVAGSAAGTRWEERGCIVWTEVTMLLCFAALIVWSLWIFMAYLHACRTTHGALASSLTLVVCLRHFVSSFSRALAIVRAPARANQLHAAFGWRSDNGRATKAEDDWLAATLKSALSFA